MIAYLKKLIENEGKNLYLFGAGEHGKAVSKSLSLVGIRYNGIFDNLPLACPNFSQSSEVKSLPFFIFILSTSASLASILFIISSLDISRLNTITGVLACIAT